MTKTRQATPLPSRERRVQRTLRKLSLYILTILGIAALAWLIRSRTTGDGADALTGFLTALPTVLPFGIFILLRRAYRQMDEFGQRLQERACAAAFVATVLATSAIFAASFSSGVVIPLWAVLVFAVLAYSTAVIRGRLAVRGAYE